ncbi:MAG: hypothetical protein IJ122_05965 [Methanobrevibacter sp.]|nr:hypothetical protein [Methanobrevibacter sp.]
MDTNTAIITILVAVVGGLGGLSSLIKTILDYRSQKRKDTEESKLKSLTTQIESLQEEQKFDALNQSKTLLLLLINFYPNDHQSILKEAENYRFILHGNTWMIDLLKKWADKEEVNIDYILNYHINEGEKNVNIHR